MIRLLCTLSLVVWLRAWKVTAFGARGAAERVVYYYAYLLEEQLDPPEYRIAAGCAEFWKLTDSSPRGKRCTFDDFLKYLWTPDPSIEEKLATIRRADAEIKDPKKKSEYAQQIKKLENLKTLPEDAVIVRSNEDRFRGHLDQQFLDADVRKLQAAVQRWSPAMNGAWKDGAWDGSPDRKPVRVPEVPVMSFTGHIRPDRLVDGVRTDGTHVMEQYHDGIGKFKDRLSVVLQGVKSLPAAPKGSSIDGWRKALLKGVVDSANLLYILRLEDGHSYHVKALNEELAKMEVEAGRSTVIQVESKTMANRLESEKPPKANKNNYTRPEPKFQMIDVDGTVAKYSGILDIRESLEKANRRLLDGNGVFREHKIVLDNAKAMFNIAGCSLKPAAV